MSVLEEELAYFREKKGELLQQHQGQFALIKGRELVGLFPTFEEAYRVGLSKFGNVSVLIKQIVEPEPAQQTPALTYGLLRAPI